LNTPADQVGAHQLNNIANPVSALGRQWPRQRYTQSWQILQPQRALVAHYARGKELCIDLSKNAPLLAS
jgi:hypothetical protein